MQTFLTPQAQCPGAQATIYDNHHH